MSRTATVPRLFGHAPEPRLAMNAQDMARRALPEGALVKLESRRGALYVIVQPDESVRSGQCWLPMHWGKRFLGGRASEGVNTVTSPACDPISRQPELKHAAVRVGAAALPWHLVAFAEVADERLAELLAGFQQLQPDVAFAAAVPMGRERPGLLLRAASERAPGAEWLERLDALVGLDAPGVLRYEDPRDQQSRRVRIEGERLRAVRLAGTPESVARGEWLRDWLANGDPVAKIRRFLLFPDREKALAAFGSAPNASSRIACQCLGVSEGAIRAALATCGGAPAERIAALQERLGCGTQCGSCLPELRSLAEAVPTASKSAEAAG